MSQSIHLISDAKYAQILSIVSHPKQNNEALLHYKYRQQYTVDGNIQGQCLYHNNLVVTTFEQVFDVMLEAHSKISHVRDPKTKKKYINDYLGYYGVPREAAKCFVETCPLVTLCSYLLPLLLHFINIVLFTCSLQSSTKESKAAAH